MRRMLRLSCLTLAVLALAACGADERADSGEPTDNLPAGAALAASATAEPSPRIPIVVIDPGHGGPQVGAATPGLSEKESNLDMALRVEALLEGMGVRVLLTRRDDVRASGASGASDDGVSFGANRGDLQTRVDLANAEKADLFLSIHSNGSSDGGQQGVEMWYDSLRPFAERNRAFAEMLQESVVGALREYGYPVVDRGLKDDACFRFRRDRCFQLFVLGPQRETTREEAIDRGGDPDLLGFLPGQDAILTRATQMPGVLAELLFFSNAQDAAALKTEPVRDTLAQALASTILRFLGLGAT